MPPEDRVRVLHMIEAIETAQQFIAHRTRADLDTDQMFLFALVRAIEIIGEAAGRISHETRAKAPAIPWPFIIAMRNRLAHAYFDINRDILWSTTVDELPQLLLLLRPLAEAA